MLCAVVSRSCLLASANPLRVTSLRLSGLSFTQQQKLREISHRNFKHRHRIVATSANVQLAAVRFASSSVEERRVVQNGNGNGCKNGKSKEVIYEELVQLIDKGDVRLVDVREPKELQKTGQIPKSINIPLKQLKHFLQQKEKELEEPLRYIPCPQKDDANLIYYGLSQVKGLAALEIAHKLGYKKSRHYPGGWEEWSQKQNKI